MIEKRLLGRLAVDIQPIGFGCAAIGGYYIKDGRVASRGQVDDHETIRAIHTALDHEIRLFDVANIYGAGHAERVLGQALHDRRDRAILQVKFGASFDEVTRQQIDYSGRIEAAWIRNSLEGSLRRLQTDYIDIFQFQIADYDLQAMPEILDHLNHLVQEGKIRTYSIGTGDLERARLFAEAPHTATIITSLNVLMDAAEMLKLVASYPVALLAGVPYFMGFLTGKYHQESQFAPDDLRHQMNLQEGRFADILQKIEALREPLTSEGRTMAQGALAWIWARHPQAIPVPGIKTADQVKACVDALAIGALTTEQMNAIDAILGRSPVSGSPAETSSS